MTVVANAFNLPSEYNLVFSKASIDLGIEKLAKEIRAWASRGMDEQPLSLCVLRGGAFFYADLIRALNCSVEMGFCNSWTYSSETNVQIGSVSESNNIERHRFSLERCDVANRSVILVDDICDTGGTLAFISQELLKRGAKEVKSAVLIHRKMSGSKFDPDWRVFEYHGSEWFVGYGMEDRNHFANLPQVYTIVTESP